MKNDVAVSLMLDLAKEESLMKLMSELARSNDIDEWGFNDFGIWWRSMHSSVSEYDELLADIEKITPIEPGSIIEFEADNGYQWMLEKTFAGWVEKERISGYKKADEPDYEELKSMFIDYVTNDLEGSNPDYVLEMLENVGCNEKFRKALGFDFPEEEGDE